MASAAASVNDSVSIFRLGMADGLWRLGTLDDRLCARNDRNLPTGPERFDFPYAIGRGGRNCSVVGGDRLCGESKSDLSANHGNDRAFIPRVVYLGGCVLLRIRTTGSVG